MTKQTEAATMTKDSLATSLLGLKDPDKQFVFIAGLYTSVVLASRSGLYFGALRSFLCDVFPAMAKDGNYGKWCPILGTIAAEMIEKKFTGVEEREAKTAKGNKPKFHVVVDKGSCEKTLKGLENRFGEKFSSFVAGATEVFIQENSNGSGGDWKKMANDFTSFYA